MVQQHSRQRISACLIVKNEEVRLPDCLRSLSGYVDEIIVADTGSTDATRDIVREFACTLIDIPWENDFSKARNHALRHATGNWILSIDADERLLNPDILRNTVTGSPASVGGYLVDVESPALRSDDTLDTYNTAMLRLFRNDTRIRFYGSVHEQVTDTILSAGFSIERSSIQLFHHGYALSAAEMQEKQLRNLHLLHTVIAARPLDGYALLQRGKTFLALGAPREALVDFGKITAGRSDATPLLLAQAHNYTGIILYQMGQYEEALHNALASLQLLPDQAFAHYIAGECRTALKKFAEALESYLYMRHQMQTDTVAAAVAGDYRLPPSQLAFRRGLADNPQDTGCLVGCAEIALRSNRTSEAVALLQKARDREPEREDIRSFLAIAESYIVQNAPAVPSATALAITGAIIVGDNPDGLERALSSLQLLCDHIVVVHTGSSQEIVDIARRFTTQVFRQPWEQNFSAARNAALEHCRGDWTIMLDSDESFSAETARTVRQAVTSAPATVGGLLTTMEHITESGHSHTHVLRIFRNRADVRYEGYVHEQITPSLTRAGLTIQENFEIVLQHHPRPMDAAKHEQYRALLEREIERLGDRAEWALFQYALLLFNFGDELDFLASLQALDRYLQHPLMRRDNAAVLLNSYARRLLDQKDWQRLAGIAEDSIAYYPEQREAWWYSFLAHARLGEREHTRYTFRTLRTMYLAEKYLSTLAFEKEPSVRDICREALHTAEQSHDRELLDLAGAFARQHDFQIPASTQDMVSPQVERSRSTPDPSPKPLLSVSMIVKNEQKFLPGCLDSLRGLADEIIIADTGSTDATIDIARAHGASVVYTNWNGDFAEARNFSLQHCKGKWVLYIDADERMLPEQAQYIRTMLETAPEYVGAFLCTIISPHRQNNNTTETHTGAYPRLFRNLGYPAVQFQGRVHEQISPSILNADLKIAASDIVIQHLGYDQSPDVMRTKVQRNFELLMQHIQEEPTNGQAWLQLGFTLAFMQKKDEAEQALKFALQLGNLNIHLEASAASTLAQLAGSSGKFAEALHWAEYSLTKAPRQVYGLHLKAHALLYLRRFDEAETTFMEVLRRIDQPVDTQAGYDVAIDRSIVLQGLEKARRKMV
jgi:glycosyltransferase involved in cell wall biosynthesis/cytochrome c-type biogenesis protein CcmH/NrfG